MRSSATAALLGLLLTAGVTAGAEAPGPSASVERLGLPQDQEYQRVLRQHMATLAEKDFDHGVTNHLTVPPANTNAEYQYRTFVMAMLQQPHVGGKRGIAAVNAPAHNFLLTTIERTNAIVVPPVWEEALATFIQWDSPGNVYRDSRALKMRTFVAASVKLMMVDHHLDLNATSGVARADWHGYHLITAASAYPAFKDVLPAPVQKAYEAGLLRFSHKLLAMGPKGEECDYEMSAAVGLWYAAHATGDAQLAKEAEAYARRLCTDPRFMQPDGYWVEAGGLDLGFGGIANFWTVWLALASDWPFARETVEKAYRFRAHLCLPEPDGRLTGPSAFNNRIGSPASEDQWHWDGARDHAAAMLTDEAVCFIRIPTQAQLEAAMEVRTQVFNEHLYGNLRNAPYRFPDGKRYDESGHGRYLRNDEIKGYPWIWRIFPNGYNYPMEVNPGYEFYRPGSFAHLVDLQERKSPMLSVPFLRGGTFVTNFGNAFVVARQPTFGAILHVGPVGHPEPGAGMAIYKGPMGFGGGQLSAFWTPEAGAAILARRSAMFMRGAETVCFDSNAVWRLWPIHAVSGCTKEGLVFSSGRIVNPVVTNTTARGEPIIQVNGVLALVTTNEADHLSGRLDYARTFRLSAKAVRVETTLRGDGQDALAELYETIPVYLGEAKSVSNAAVTIEFRAAKEWKAADVTPTEGVTAVRIIRFSGAVQIAFDKPQRVALSPAVWQDRFLTTARCRNIMVDLLGDADRRPSLGNPIRVAYTFTSTPGPAGQTGKP